MKRLNTHLLRSTFSNTTPRPVAPKRDMRNRKIGLAVELETFVMEQQLAGKLKLKD